jgi:hypothetical protein
MTDDGERLRKPSRVEGGIAGADDIIEGLAAGLGRLKRRGAH